MNDGDLVSQYAGGKLDEVERVGLWNQPDLALNPRPDSSQTTSSTVSCFFLCKVKLTTTI